MKKVFLGGTCNNSTWRDELIPMLSISYFNPVVEDWTEECQVEEIKQREECDFCLYVITSEMTGVYSIAEAVEDGIKRPEKTIFCHIEDDKFTFAQIKSLRQTSRLIAKNNAQQVFTSLEDVAKFLNIVGNL